MRVPVLVAVKAGVLPETGFEFASNKVIVIVAVEVPLATTGPPEATMVEVTAEAAPAANTMVLPVTAGLAKDTVLVSALVEAKVQVDTPLAFEALQVP